MAEALFTAAIGFVSGVLSGLFGIGGGVITTPAIKLLLGAPAIVAVATPLPVIVPGAVAGSISYARAKVSDVRSGFILGLVGAPFAVTGAVLTKKVGGTVVLLATAALVLWMAGDMLLQTFRVPRARGGIDGEADPTLAGSHADGEFARPNLGVLLGTGAVAGLYSGFLGLGGGFVLVPMMTRFMHFPMKRAIGTSLTAVAILAIPGTITHGLLGHIDWPMALALVVGVIPGALLGARISLGSSERLLRIGFATILAVTAVLLGVNVLGGL
jgi:uncharacterized membrane protein YfcA